jgi:hypothetical protein
MFRTSNGIEPRCRDGRRRTDAIGTFVDDASMERLLFGLIPYFKRKYSQKVCREFGQSRKVARLCPACPNAFARKICRYP